MNKLIAISIACLSLGDLGRAFAHPYNAALQREQAAFSISTLMCRKENGYISSLDYENQVAFLSYRHISTEGEIVEDHTHLTPKRNKSRKIHEIAAKMSKNMDRNCAVIDANQHSVYLEQAHNLCELRKELCEALKDPMEENWYPVFKSRLHELNEQRKNLSTPEELEEHKEIFCKYVTSTINWLEEQVPLWNELGTYNELMPDFDYSYFPKKFKESFSELCKWLD